MKYVFIVFSVALFIYMVLPGPTKVEQFNALPGSLKSDEPGDTVQHPNIAGYYSNYYRSFVIPFYKQEFAKQFNYFGLSLPFLRINHPPEEGKEVVKPYIESWYLEEFIHPLRESLFVSGWEPYDEQGRRRTNYAYEMFVNGVQYKTKVNLRYYPASIWVKIIVWGGITVSIYLLYQVMKKTKKEHYA